MLLDRPSGSGRPSSGKFYDSAGVKRPLHVGQAAYQFAFFFRLSKSSGWYDFSNVLFADGVLNKFGLWKAGTAVKVIGGNGVYWNAEGGQIQTYTFYEGIRPGSGNIRYRATRYPPSKRDLTAGGPA